MGYSGPSLQVVLNARQAERGFWGPTALAAWQVSLCWQAWGSRVCWGPCPASPGSLQTPRLSEPSQQDAFLPPPTYLCCQLGEVNPIPGTGQCPHHRDTLTLPSASPSTASSPLATMDSLPGPGGTWLAATLQAGNAGDIEEWGGGQTSSAPPFRLCRCPQDLKRWLASSTTLIHPEASRGRDLTSHVSSAGMLWGRHPVPKRIQDQEQRGWGWDPRTGPPFVPSPRCPSFCLPHPPPPSRIPRPPCRKGPTTRWRPSPEASSPRSIHPQGFPNSPPTFPS